MLDRTLFATADEYATKLAGLDTAHAAVTAIDWDEDTANVVGTEDPDIPEFSIAL